MAFRNGARANIWKLEPHEKYTDAQISTSRRKSGSSDANPEYENDFSGYARFIGGAHEKIKGCPTVSPNGSKLLATIKLEDVACTKMWVKEKQKEYIGYQVYDFSFETQNGQTQSRSQTPSADSFNYIPDGMAEEMPFS